MILVTGAAGFIGYHLCKSLIDRGEKVVGVDNLNDYYDVQLKKDRLKQLESEPAFSFEKVDICDFSKLLDLFSSHQFSHVCHLAAQVGVRYSLENPFPYQKSNLEGFLNILEACRKFPLKNLVYASSSSIYGADPKIPFSEEEKSDRPISLYGATKRANELMAHSYSYLYNIPITGLRFFTVYGPWMRPDMALFKFASKIQAGEPIDVYGNGKMKRNFTYIDDIIQGVILSLDKPQPYALYNIGNDRTEILEDYIKTLETCLGIPAIKNYLPQQPGDMTETWADLSKIQQDLGYKPTTNIDTGIKKFVEWFKDYYRPQL
jgi:UDP-glucuronate 4-epimerase